MCLHGVSGGHRDGTAELGKARVDVHVSSGTETTCLLSAGAYLRCWVSLGCRRCLSVPGTRCGTLFGWAHICTHMMMFA
jgi:hypothetical protein